MMDKQQTANATEANPPTDVSGTATEEVVEDLNTDPSGAAGTEHIVEDLNDEIRSDRFADEKTVDN